MPRRYWFLTAKNKDDFAKLRDDQRWMLTRVDYASEDEAARAKLRLQRSLGIELAIGSESSKSA
jgi:hypothetical protein